MKRTTIAALVFAVGFGTAIPASVTHAATPGATQQTVLAVKCINLKTGIARNLPGKKCPKGWVADAAQTAQRKRAAYLDAARRLEPALYSVDDDTVFGAGRSICRVLDAGGNFEQIISTIISSGLDSETGAALIVASIEYLCPGHKQFLNNFLDG